MSSVSCSCFVLSESFSVKDQAICNGGLCRNFSVEEKLLGKVFVGMSEIGLFYPLTNHCIFATKVRVMLGLVGNEKG